MSIGYRKLDVHIAPEELAPPIARNWSPNQLAVFDWVEHSTGNAIIEAVAGAGKTTTVVEAIRHFPSSSRVAICAYNKKMGDELKMKTSGMPNVTAGTLHSFGFQALRRSRGKLNVDDKKIQTIVWRMIDADPLRRLKPAQNFIIKLVMLAKDSGVGLFGSDPLGQENDNEQWRRLVEHYDLSVENGHEASSNYVELINFAIGVLCESNADRYNIDFADMIYQALLHQAPIDPYDVVIVDEAQDTNPTRRALAAKMLKPDGRAVFVGDPFQSIYAFSGADNDSLDQIRTTFNCTTLQLNASYRCPVKIVEHARRWVTHIEPVDTAILGEVKTITYNEFMNFDGSSKSTTFNATDAILCRKTSPLVTIAFELIRRGIGCRIEGRDIGMQLVNLVRKWKTRSLADLSRRLDDYRKRELERAVRMRADVKAAQIDDRCDTLRVLIDRAASQKLDVDGLVVMIQSMFGDSDYDRRQLLTLSTIHKAKGREWDVVYLVGRSQYQPSKYAKQAWELDQERNLIYVAVTRAKRMLVEVEQVP